MKLSVLFRGDSAVLKGNFLLITVSLIILFAAQPIPDTYASLFYLHLGANTFMLSIIGFAGSIAVAFVQFPGGYLADKHGRRWLIVTMTFGLAVGSLFFIFCALVAIHSDRASYTKPMFYLRSCLNVHDY
jgi:MFS family permease